MYEIVSSKVAVVGDAYVGKTSIVQALLSGGAQFSKNYIMTPDVVVYAKNIEIPESKDVVELLLSDSAGNPLYVDYLPKFWKELNAAFVVFDVTSEESFTSITKWVDFVKSVLVPPIIEGSSDNSIPGVIFANKSDLVDRRVVNSDKGKFLASQLGFGYFEGSAKNNISIEEAFKYLAKELYHKIHLTD